MPPSWQLSPARSRKDHSLQSQRWCCRRAILYRHDDGAAAVLKSSPEIKNRCSPEAILEFFLASIPKSGPEIKNQCTKNGISRQNHASIPKSGPEIKNRCSGGGSGVQQAKPFFFAATKNRIGRGYRRRYGRCRRAILLCSDETLQRFASLDLKSRIDARKRV